MCVCYVHVCVEYVLSHHGDRVNISSDTFISINNPVNKKTSSVRSA